MNILNSRRASYEELLPAPKSCFQSNVWQIVAKSLSVVTLCFVGLIFVAQFTSTGYRVNNPALLTRTKSTDDILVTLDLGQLKGKELESRDGRKYLGFLGVPFAKPPIGELRFMPTEKLEEPWSGVWDATEFKQQCIQLLRTKDPVITDVVGSEDCLYLNVFTPKAMNELGRRRNRFPVIVYLHGGIQNGNSSQYGADYFMDEDVVLVMVHYRLHVLGSLNTGDSVARGNFAIKDQVMALSWVKENIGAFGGDKQRVTIYGTSFGAMMTSVHLLSPMSKGLFHRAIMQSGTLFRIETIDNGREEAEKLAKVLNCPTTSSQEIFDCFRNTSAEVLTMAAKDFNFDITVEPKSDNPKLDNCLPDEPLKLLKEGNFNSVPAIHGVTSAESFNQAISYLLSLSESSCSSKVSETKKNQIIAELVHFNYAKDPEAIAQKLRNYYFTPYVLTKDSVLQNLTNLLSDRQWVHGMTVYVRGQLSSEGQTGRPIFLYYYTKELESSYADVYKDEWGETSVPFGPQHADDLQLYFPSNKFPFKPPGSQYYNLSKSVVKMWVNFAATANPTQGEDIEWTPLEKSDDSLPLNWFEINDEFRMFEPYGLHDRIRLWDSFNITDLYI